jgi:uncharacterized protein involved in exopolysaccharide biosynthesis
MTATPNDLHPNPPSDGFVTLRLLWSRGLLICGVALIFGALGTTYSLLVTPIFRAQVTLLPVANRPGQGLMGQLGTLSGLTGLAGINLDDADKAEALAVLNSRDFARKFIEERNLLTVILDDKWDPVTRNWKNQSANQPDIRDAVERFGKKILRVGEDRKNGLVILTIDWKDPVLATQWANIYAQRINGQMREYAITNAERSIDYLRRELSSTSEVALKQSISQLLESQMQKMMVARGNSEYAFRVVDQASVPKRHIFPRRTLIVIGCTLIGGFLACAWVMLVTASGHKPV